MQSRVSAVVDSEFKFRHFPSYNMKGKHTTLFLDTFRNDQSFVVILVKIIIKMLFMIVCDKASEQFLDDAIAYCRSAICLVR